MSWQTHRLSHPYLIITLFIIVMGGLHLLSDREHEQAMIRLTGEMEGHIERVRKLEQEQEILVRRLSESVGHFSDGRSDWRDVVRVVEQATSDLQSSPSYRPLINDLEGILAQMLRLTGEDEARGNLREEIKMNTQRSSLAPRTEEGTGGG